MASYSQCITNGSTIRVTAGYPYYSDGSRHGGIDTVHTNLLSYAPKSGTVVTAHVWNGATTGNDSWGNYIVVRMADGNYWLAAHFATQTHSVGESINEGDYIGQQGATGNVTGKHTHWEYWQGGYGTAYRQNPQSILRIPNTVGTFDVTWDTESSKPEPPEPGSSGIIRFTPEPGIYRNWIRVSLKAIDTQTFEELPGTLEYFLSPKVIFGNISYKNYTAPIPLAHRKYNYIHVKFTPDDGEPIYTIGIYRKGGLEIWKMCKRHD